MATAKIKQQEIITEVVELQLSQKEADCLHAFLNSTSPFINGMLVPIRQEIIRALDRMVLDRMSEECV